MPYAKMEQNTKTNTETKLTWIAERAYDKRLKFTSLAHHLNEEYLSCCFQQLQRGKASGVDGRTAESYSRQEIECAIEQTVQQMKEGSYLPQPVRRVYIGKATGEKRRPLGIPTVLDKVVQLGIAKILEVVYEPLFSPASYGYRPGRDAHACLKEINHMIMGRKVNWIIEADIAGFFDTIDHQWMMRCLEERIADPTIKNLISRFLKAGVMEEREYQKTERGTPQGGNISPILANIYLHYILDIWFELIVKKHCKGYVQLIRYADDFIIGIQYKEEAHSILTELTQRLKKFNLELAGGKTRMMEFGRFAQENQEKQGNRKPNTFDFLGFTHYCSQTKDGRFQMKVKTSKSKMSAARGAMKTWLKKMRNKIKSSDMWKSLRSKLIGHYNYYGVSGNFEAIHTFYYTTKRLLYKWLNRRNRKKHYNWEQLERYMALYPLPQPKLTYVIYNTW